MHRPMEQNRQQRNKPIQFGQLYLTKGRILKWNNNSFFNSGFRRSAQVHPKKMKLDHQLTPYTKINSRWIKDLNVSHDSIKVLEKIIGKKVSDIPCSYNFTNISPRARDIKERINKWDLIKIKSFCMGKENTNKMERKPTAWENIFANDTTDKGLSSKIYKELT